MTELSKPTISNTQTLLNPQVNRCTSVQVACMSYMDLALGAFLGCIRTGQRGLGLLGQVSTMQHYILR